MTSRSFGAVLAGIATLAGGAVAQAQEVPTALQGYSIIGDRVEAVSYPTYSFNQHWVVRAYISRGGRIFAKQTLDSQNPHNHSGTQAMISSDGSEAPFTWNGGGISRQWTNPNNGVVLRLSESIAQGPRGPTCRMDLERENASGFSVRVVRQSCHMFRGNAVAD